MRLLLTILFIPTVVFSQPLSQIQTKEQENTSFVRFKQVQFKKPDADLFEPPNGYTQYSDPQELMQGVMKKVMEGKK